MFYSYVEIEYIATSFSPARTDLALKLLTTPNTCASTQHALRILRVSLRLAWRPSTGWTCDLKLHGQTRDLKLHGWTRNLKLHGRTRDLNVHGRTRNLKLHGWTRDSNVHGWTRNLKKVHARMHNLKKTCQMTWLSVQRMQKGIITYSDCTFLVLDKHLQLMIR